MIGTGAFIGIAMMIAFGLLLPFSAAVWWIKTRRENATTVLLGAATWFVFAMILESLPKALLFNPALSVGKAVTQNVVLYTVIGALMAGIFEETGRLVVFKTFLRNRKNRETAVSHGIGHGGIEAVFTLTVGGIQNIVFAVLIRQGLFQTLIDKTAAAGADVSALQSLPQQIAEITPGLVCFSAAERVSAMLLHVGLSVLVFYAVKRSKPLLFVLSIFLHALFDVPAALYQFGALRSIYVLEAILAVYAVVFFVIVWAGLYRKDRTEDCSDGIDYVGTNI